MNSKTGLIALVSGAILWTPVQVVAQEASPPPAFEEPDFGDPNADDPDFEDPIFAPVEPELPGANGDVTEAVPLPEQVAPDGVVRYGGDVVETPFGETRDPFDAPEGDPFGSDPFSSSGYAEDGFSGEDYEGPADLVPELLEETEELPPPEIEIETIGSDIDGSDFDAMSADDMGLETQDVGDVAPESNEDPFAADPFGGVQSDGEAGGAQASAGRDERTLEPRDYVRLRALDKITGSAEDVVVRIGETVSYRGIDLTPRACHQTPPEEAPPESVAYVEVIANRTNDKGDAAETDPRLFSGWMFASSPGLNAMEHGVYDVWVINCMTSAP